MKKLVFGFSLCAVLVFGLLGISYAEVLLVDDFDDAAKPNYLGGSFGSWNKDPNDTTQVCLDSFDADTKYGTSGYSLKLGYDVDSPNPAYNGFWMALNNVDLRAYNALVFYVKGDTEKGFTTQFKIELKTVDGEVGRYLITGVSDKWKKVVIPFKKINGITDWSKMSQFVIVFDDINATDKEGVVFIDNITFQTL